MHAYRRFCSTFLFCCLQLVFGAALCFAQDAPPENTAGNGPHGNETPNNGQDITRPLTRFDVRYQYLNSSRKDSDHDDQHIATLRVDRPFLLGGGWKLAARFDVPLMLTNFRSEDNLAGHARFGLGDVLAQALLVREVSPRFAWVAGVEAVLPTATEETMGTGTLQLAPTAAVRWSTDELRKGSWIALAGRWSKSVINARDEHTNVNELQFAPVINIPITQTWFVDLFPSTDIRYNLGEKREGDSGRWFVPFNFLVGTLLDKTTVASIEVSIPIIKDYDLYDFKTELRLGFFF